MIQVEETLSGVYEVKVAEKSEAQLNENYLSDNTEQDENTVQDENMASMKIFVNYNYVFPNLICPSFLHPLDNCNIPISAGTRVALSYRFSNLQPVGGNVVLI